MFVLLVQLSQELTPGRVPTYFAPAPDFTYGGRVIPHIVELTIGSPANVMYAMDIVK